MSAFKKLLLISLMMALLGVGFGLFVAFQLQQRYTGKEPNWQTSIRVMVEPRSVFPDRDVLYVLILGTDYNFTEKDIMYTKNVRSDTVMLARLDLKNQQLRLLSIPRDMRVQIPGQAGYDRMNSAFAIGGAKLSKTVVQNLLGIPIDYIVRIKEEGLKNLVDAIGGIDIDVEKDMDYVDHWGHLAIHLKKGHQHVNGDKAAQYSRFRHDETGDYGRIERQQKVIKTIQKRFADPAVLASLGNIVTVARKNIETDMQLPQLLALANLFKGSKASGVETITLPTMPKDIQEGKIWVSYVVLDEEEGKKALEKFTAEGIPVYNTSVLRIEVLNGSGIPGKAQEVAEKLRARGFLVARVTNADRFDYTETQIVDHTGQGEGRVLTKILRKATTLSAPQEPRQIDVTVIVGRDF